MPQKLNLKSSFEPAGGQPAAITQLTRGIEQGMNRQTLLGVTGSGKTFTVANAIANTQKPALVVSHNKTLAAQLASEFKEFFPENAVEYFVSYYDYYQPEAYLPRTDTYIAKDASINEEIDRLRHSAMEAILTRQDVIVVASVSCIYGLGTPENYLQYSLTLTANQSIDRQELLRQLTRLQYTRAEHDLLPGTFLVRGDTVDIHPASQDSIIRVEFFGPSVERLLQIDDITSEVLATPDSTTIFPATFFMTDQDQLKTALDQIRQELATHSTHLEKQGKLVEAQRLQQRVTHDLEMIEQLGYVSGIENYSRYLDQRQPGEPPATLIDYFLHSFGRDGFLTIIDESHMTIPQIGGMHGGDQARKKSLITHGFRLPSAYDNRPLQFHEFEDRIGQTIYISATPAQYELNTSQQVVEQIIRPTGLLDPPITIRPTQHQIDDVISEIQATIAKQQRVLVTTLTKRMAEELATYLIEIGIKATYLHADIDTFERLEILRSLRTGTYDVVVGINLLREGLDLPEVALVAIMDADKEGYLRSATALIQTIGRAARHQEGRVLMYADRHTGSMNQAIAETERRRAEQEAFNTAHNITPRSIRKRIQTTRLAGQQKEIEEKELDIKDIPAGDRHRIVKELESKMELAARNLEFERAAQLRDTITKIRQATHPRR